MVSRATSSSVVQPAATLISPLRRNVSIPRSIAFFFNSKAEAPTRTSSLISSSTSITSYRPVRPLYPVLLQVPQPLPFWLFTHVHKAGDRLGRAVGMQCRKNQVSGQCRFNCNFCRFEVSNFTYQNDVGVLPQECAQRGREIQADLLLHLYLVNTLKLELDWILGGHDVGVRGVQTRNG